jgi:hypothetical protein
VPLSDFNERRIFSTDFENFANNKAHENPFTVNQVVQCIQTERHEEGNSRFSQFCEST